MRKLIRSKYFMATLAALVTFTVYLPTLQNGFINWDDNVNVYENKYVKSFDTAFLKWAFFDFSAPGTDYWRPLSYLSHALDYALWGLNPLGHHLTNNILHTLNTFLVVLLAMRLMEVFNAITGQNGTAQPFLHDRTIKITGVATGLLFGLHPLHVESVAWVAERKDLLCVFFFLLSIIAYTRYVRDVKASASASSASRFFNRKYLLALVFFVLSLASKPMAVTLPLVLMLLDWNPFGRILSRTTFWTAVREKLPFFAFALISSVLTILGQKAAGALGSPEAYPFAPRLLVAAKALIAYLGKIALPFNLVPFYSYPENISFFSFEYGVPLILLAAITATFIIVARNHKLWISCWGYYVVTLIPVMGLVQAGYQSMADRYTYLPSLGPFFVTGFITAMAYEKISAFHRWNLVLRTAGSTFALTMLISLSYVTTRQISIWGNDITFWEYIVDKAPPSGDPLAHINLGDAYLASRLVEKALEQYQAALRLKPGYVAAYNGLGNVSLLENRFDLAMKYYEAVLRVKPDLAETHFNLGFIYLKKGSLDMARTEFELGLKIKPDDDKARRILNSIN